MRKSNWESELSLYISKVREAEFSYGIHDCCTFCAGAVEVMTGQDPMKEFRGKYSSLTGSVKALKKIGEGDLFSTLDQKFEPIPIGKAGRGDLVGLGDSVGIALGKVALFVSDGDVARISRGEWERAWKV